MEETEGDADFHNYKFLDGRMLPDLCIQYVTMVHAHRNSNGETDNGIVMLHRTNASGKALLAPEF